MLFSIIGNSRVEPPSYYADWTKHLVLESSGRSAFNENAPMKMSHKHRGTMRAGFKIVELGVIVSVCAFLMALSLPMLMKAKVKSKAVVCLDNKKQLIDAWTLYAKDHADQLVVNQEGKPGEYDSVKSWVSNWINDDSFNTGNTNSQWLIDPEHAALARYISSPGVYKCTEASNTVTLGTTQWPRVRSVSMNQAMGLTKEGAAKRKNPWDLRTLETAQPGQQYYKIYRKLSDIETPHLRWVFLDEHPDSVNDGTLAMEFPETPGSERYWDVPAASHDGNCAFAFADGHTEIHTWSDSRTRIPVKNSGHLVNVKVPGSVDVQWLLRAATILEGVKQ